MRYLCLSDKVFSFTEENALFSPPCHVVVGVSGGADSVALLHLLTRWPQSGITLTVVHVHHGLRGETAQRDMAFVEALCSAWGVTYIGVRADIPSLVQATGMSVEEAGRHERYRLFEEIRQQVGADYVLTAHTASDQAETVLMHLLRGCGTDGLSGIPATRGCIRRPLLCCSREDVEHYCAEHGLSYMTDETNTDLRYTRNRIRHEILPLLRQVNPAVDQALCRLATHSGEDSRYLSVLAQEALDLATLPDGAYRCDAFSRQPASVRRRMIRRILADLALPQISESHILAVERLLQQGRGETVLPLGTVLRAESGRLFLAGKEKPFSPSEFSVDVLPFTHLSEENTYTLRLISVKDYTEWENVHKLFFKSSIDYDKIQGGLCVRNRRSGDILHPAGRGVGKSLKKLMNEWGIPPSTRNSLPLLCDREGVVLVPGYTCDERVRVTPDTKHFLVWTNDSVQR